MKVSDKKNKEDSSGIRKILYETCPYLYVDEQGIVHRANSKKEYDSIKEEQKDLPSNEKEM